MADQPLLVREHVYVPRAMLQNIKAHALEWGDLECCGLLAGDGVNPVMLARCGNTAVDPRRHFRILPQDQYQVEQSFARLGQRLIGVYHSHPGKDATPSLTDLTSIPAELLSLIYSVPDDEVKAWRGSQQVSIEPV